jgi:hypothetical protein
LSSHKSIAKETQQEEGDYENQNNQHELLYQEHYACENGDNEHYKIRDNIFPCDLFLIKLLRLALGKKQGA